MADAFSNSLRDIHGLDSIPWWPPAPGWWYVLGAIVLVPALIVAGYWLTYRGPWLGWRSDARRNLAALRKALPKGSPRDVAGQLSELLRRIAMARSGRRTAPCQPPSGTPASSQTPSGSEIRWITGSRSKISWSP